jgi:hypothetical protein
MTAREMIEMLEKCTPETEVLFWLDDGSNGDQGQKGFLTNGGWADLRHGTTICFQIEPKVKADWGDDEACDEQ